MIDKIVEIVDNILTFIYTAVIFGIFVGITTCVASGILYLVSKLVR